MNGTTQHTTGKDGVLNVINHLGYIQIDTINVVERAHHHTLWTRIPDYSSDMLHDLQAIDRQVFEYWGHAASYLPMKDYRFYLPRMKAYADPHGKWEKERFVKYNHLMPDILKRIKSEGPISSADFDPPPGLKKSGWWEWRPTKFALELLFWQGELMISERRKFQRVYDLTERVLPAWVDTSVPSDMELGEFLVIRALNAHGIAQEREIADHIHAVKKATITKALKAMVGDGRVMKVKVDGLEKDYYALPQVLNYLPAPSMIDSAVHLLSPFDNLVIQRSRLNQLFGFDYVIECYVPAPKRKYGYFVLPILWGDRFIGRLDPKADRKSKTLIIRNLVFEPDFSEIDKILPMLARSIANYAVFNNCATVQIENISINKYKTTLGKLIGKHLK